LIILDAWPPMDPIDHKGADASAIANLLARSPFAGQLRVGAPLLVATGDPARIVFANQAAHGLFRTANLQQINAAAMIGASPGARRLRQLASASNVGAPPRLELLRFFVDRAPLQLPLLCARLANLQGELFLVAAAPPGGRSAAETVGAGQEMEPPDGAIATADDQQRESDGRGAAARFLWSAREPLCFDAPAKTLVDAVGDAAPRAAEPLEDWKARTGLDAGGEFARALASRATFGPLRVAWPRLAGERPADEALILLLSGAPIFDRQRRFLGYRGFGVVTGETASVESRRRVAETGASSPAASTPARPEAGAEPPNGDEERRMDVGTRPFEANAPAPSLVEAAPIAPQAADMATSATTTPPTEDSESAARSAPNRRAEIAPLRAPGQAYAAGPNVVPIRPGALRALLSMEESARGAGDGESVELTRHERDAFREIARALGAKVGDHRESPAEPRSDGSEEAATTKERGRDRIDLEAGNPAPAADSDRTPAAEDSAAAARNASDLLDRLPIGALVARGGDALYVNRTLLDLMGYRDLAEFRASSGLARILNGRTPDPAAPSAESGALSLVAADGETVAVDSQIETIAWDGAPATLISLRRSLEADWAARMRALEIEARAREGEAREFSAVIDTATDGVVILDSQGRILSLNRPGEALFGFDQTDVVGENFMMLLSPESHEPVKAYFHGLQTSGLASLLNDGREALGRERHGRAIPLFITLGRISSSPDAKFCAVLRDMTQWKTIERDLEEARGQAEKASALKSEFLAKISHEIRTPLNAILGFAEVITDERFGPVGNDRYKEYVKDIHASGAHVMSLINDLLDLSKIEAGKLDLNFAPVDANRIIQECVSLMQPQAAHERIIMRLSLFDKLPRIIADERSLRQIMLNLMSNAVKFNEPGGQVIVSTAVNDSGQAVIRVRDTGIGMSDAEIGAALEPFTQIATTRPTRGTGLGLPLTKALIEANRAGFSIKSRKEQGTLVEVAFPTAQAAAE
jgi:PAS domain S-box-containing protein